MRHLLFDASALISFGITGTLPLLEKLKKDYRGQFLIPTTIKGEIVDNAIKNQRFKYQGYQLKKLLDTKVLKIIDETPYKADIQRLSELANSTFSARGRAIKIIHPGEIALLVIAHKGSADDAVVVDE